MFDQKPGSAPGGQMGTEPEKNSPTPPPMPGGEVNKTEQVGGVEDIFSPIESENVSENKEMGSQAGPSQVAPPVPGASNDNIKVSSYKKTTKKGGSKILVFVLIFILVSAIGTAAWYYLMYLPSQNNVVDVVDQDNSVVNDNKNTNTTPVKNTNKNVNTNTVPVKNINTNINTNTTPVKNVNTNVNVNKNTNTNPVSTVDTDSDGLTDAQEAQLKTNPRLSDTDGDGLFDGEEYRIYKTSPTNPDTDGDGYKDGDEIKGGYNPNGPGKLEAPATPIIR
jgi:hypothetical protein